MSKKTLLAMSIEAMPDKIGAGARRIFNAEETANGVIKDLLNLMKENPLQAMKDAIAANREMPSNKIFVQVVIPHVLLVIGADTEDLRMIAAGIGGYVLEYVERYALNRSDINTRAPFKALGHVLKALSKTPGQQAEVAELAAAVVEKFKSPRPSSTTVTNTARSLLRPIRPRARGDTVKGGAVFIPGLAAA